MIDKYISRQDAIPVVLAAINAKPGITRAQIGAATGIKDCRVHKALTALRNSEQIGLVRAQAQRTTWWPADQMAEVRVLAKATALQAKKRRMKKYAAKLWQEHKAALQQGRDDADDKLIHRFADVNSPLPFVCTAAASVFSPRLNAEAGQQWAAGS